MSAVAVSILSIVVTIAVSIVGGLLMWSLNRTMNGLDARDDALEKLIHEGKLEGKETEGDLEKEVRALERKQHDLEIVAVKQQGQNELLLSKYENITSDLKEIEGKMVTREEFRAYMKQLESSVAIVLQRLEGRGGGYPSPPPQRSATPGPFPAQQGSRDPRREPR